MGRDGAAAAAASPWHWQQRMTAWHSSSGQAAAGRTCLQEVVLREELVADQQSRVDHQRVSGETIHGLDARHGRQLRGSTAAGKYVCTVWGVCVCVLGGGGGYTKSPGL